MQAASGGWRQPQVSKFGSGNGPPRPQQPNLVLQVVSEVLDTLQQQKQQPSRTSPSPIGGLSSSQNQQLLRSPEVNTEVNSTNLKHVITASDGQVSNGFVLHGQNLPYVFEEATDPSGARRKTSKILPVCAVCGKRFVCVTTMKRHLVTHTGEKPFACKICGKQYTQKGNLRVHERTHRNDRPFECQICNQKFYRKEPMQKHQWRQHGIVHLKSSRIHSNLSGSESIASDPENPKLIPKQELDSTVLSSTTLRQTTNSSDSFESKEVIINPRNAKLIESKSKNEQKIHYQSNTTNPAAETSPIKLKMKLAYQQHLFIDQCNNENNGEEKSVSKTTTIPKLNLINNHQSSLNNPVCKSKDWISEDKPLDLSSKSNSLLSDNQPLLLPNFTNSLFPTETTKNISTTITNVPTIKMSENGTLSKLLLQNFNTTKSAINNSKINSAMQTSSDRSKLLNGFFQSENSRTV